MTVMHYGPANGPDGLGQAVACGQQGANRWIRYTLDPKAVTCRRCLKTHELAAVSQQRNDAPEER
jgi:hypothetical protein